MRIQLAVPNKHLAFNTWLHRNACPSDYSSERAPVSLVDNSQTNNRNIKFNQLSYMRESKGHATSDLHLELTSHLEVAFRTQIIPTAPNLIFNIKEYSMWLTETQTLSLSLKTKLWNPPKQVEAIAKPPTWLLVFPYNSMEERGL